MAHQSSEDREYCALVQAVRNRTISPDLNLSSYKSVFEKLGLEDTPAGQLVVMEGNRVVIPLIAHQGFLTALQEYHSSGDSMFRLARTAVY